MARLSHIYVTEKLNTVPSYSHVIDDIRLARRLMTSRKAIAVTRVLMEVASSLTIPETKVCHHTLVSEFLLSAQLQYVQISPAQSPTKTNAEKLEICRLSP